MKKLYVVELSLEERKELKRMLKNGKRSARKLNRVRILLQADQGKWGPGWKDEMIVEAVGVSRPTVERMRKGFVEEGLEQSLEDKKRKGTRPPKLDGAGEAKLIALTCSEPPAGRQRWTLQLLADELIRLGCVKSFTGEAVRKRLKKTNLNLG